MTDLNILRTFLILYRIIAIITTINPTNTDICSYDSEIKSTTPTLFQTSRTLLDLNPTLVWNVSSNQWKKLGTCKPSTCSSYISILITLSGDIHQNPGPIKFPCSICSKPVKSNQAALQCDQCETWVHTKCDGLSKEDYNRFQNIHSLVFECPKCRLLTFTDSFFMDNSMTLSTNNSFEALSEDEDITTDNHTIQQGQTTTNSHYKKQLRMMIVNCRSLNSDKKKVDLHELIETHKPNIILGTESHLDNTIASNEVFPYQFKNTYRKDRKLGEGGVFLAVDCTYITSEITPSTNCETVWCKVSIQGSQPLYIGTFYRQPNSDIDELEELEKMISSITETQQNLPNIILGGDFNLPHINWQSTTVNTNPQYGKALNDKMVEITNNNDLTEVINVPTRGQNILDLLGVRPIIRQSDSPIVRQMLYFFES
jgi:hypothetical protein